MIMDQALFFLSICSICSIFSLFFSVVSADKYKLLPSVYELEDYTTCMDRGDLYCKSTVRLRTSGNANDTLWDLIKESANDKFSYDRSTIGRGICVPKEAAGNEDAIRIFLEMRINEKLKVTNLLYNVLDVNCTTKDHKISLYDILFLAFLTMYIIFILYVTWYDRHQRKYKEKAHKSIGEWVVKSFSLASNWEKLSKVDGNEDFNKLKSIQGIRFFNMVLIIILHSYLSYGIIYVSNLEALGEILRNPLIEYCAVLFGFIVQTFFLISSWIVTFQIYNFYRVNGHFTAKHAFIIIINRYFRLGVCSAIMILFTASNWIKLCDGPIIFDNTVLLHTPCIRNWWPTILFVNNDFYFKDMCIPSLWYLSVDFQLHIAAVITIYLILKFKLNEWKVITFQLLIYYILYGTVLYINEPNILFRIDTNFLRRHIIFRSFTLKIAYTSTYSSWGTSIIGICFGIFYTKNKHRNVIKNMVIPALWLFLFIGLPFAAILIAKKNEFKGILGPLVKPLFSAGIGIGILGMSHNIGGVIKRVCENRFIVLMSSFSFSTYVFQLPVIFSKGIGSYSMVEVGFLKTVTNLMFFDLPVCIIVGIACAMIFEQPGINLQKRFLPQLPRGKQPP